VTPTEIWKNLGKFGKSKLSEKSILRQQHQVIYAQVTGNDQAQVDQSSMVDTKHWYLVNLIVQTVIHRSGDEADLVNPSTHLPKSRPTIVQWKTRKRYPIKRVPLENPTCYQNEHNEE